MGLGKTLTIISLILKHIQVSEAADEESEDDEESKDQENNDAPWKSKGRKELRDGGEKKRFISL
jgi:hypothetical protein